MRVRFTCENGHTQTLVFEGEWGLGDAKRLADLITWSTNDGPSATGCGLCHEKGAHAFVVATIED